MDGLKELAENREQVGTPLYDALVDESAWTPADLRPAYDLDAVIRRSYDHAQRSTRKPRKPRQRRRQPRPLP